MAPPQYNDVGKNAKDLFIKGFHVGFVKLDLKTRTNTGVEFKTCGSAHQETGKVTGSVESKYRFPKYGMTLSEKWNTDNMLFSDLTIQDKGFPGLKFDANLSFSPNSGKTSAAFKTTYLHERMAFNCNLDMSNSPMLTASNVVLHNGMLAGIQSTLDIAKQKVLQNGFLLAYMGKDFSLVTNINDGQEYKAAIYQKVNPNLDIGIIADWTAGSNSSRLSVAAKYLCNNDVTLRGKINNASMISLSYEQRIRKELLLTFSINLDSKSFNNGGHKIGVALELEP